MSDTDTASSPRSLATLLTLTSPDRVLFLAMKGRLLCLLAVLCAILSLPAQAGIEASETLDDFEGPLLAEEFFILNGGSTVVAVPIPVSDADPLAQPGQAGDNGILLVDYNVSDFGSFGESFELAGAQDWSRYTSFDFWFYGTGSGLTYQAEIYDNRSDPNIDTSERFDYAFVDDTPGWQYISIPFEDFTRATDLQPGDAPDDGFTLTEIYAWVIVLPLGADTVFFDDVGLGQRIVDDFESGLPSGFDTNGTPIGFFTFSGGSLVGISTTSIPPAPLPPAVGVLNNVLQVDLNATAFAGFIHSFENEAVDTWITQDWSRYSGISLWIYGNNSSTSMFIDLLENRNPGSTVDDAERWTVDFVDDFSGWQRLEFPFTGFTRKEIGNGAPNDGLTLQSVHGWAFGTLGTGGPRTYYLDGVALFGAAEVPPLTVGFATSINQIDEGTTGNVVVALNRPMNADDPAQVSVDIFTDSTGATATVDRDYLPTSGTLTFVNGGPTELSFPIETLEDTKFEGTERFGLQLANPVNVDLDLIRTASGIIEDNDPFDPFLIDDFEQGAFLWQADPGLFLNTSEIASSDPWARPGQDPFERILAVSTPIAVDIVIAGSLCNKGNGVVPLAILTTDNFDATTVDHTTVRFGAASETHGNRKGVKRHEEDFDGDGDLDLVFHFRVRETGYDCGEQNTVLTGATFDDHPITAGGEVSFGRDFPLGQDWSEGEALRFWFYGTGSGDSITLTLKDNRAPDPGPSGWNLVWSDEFDEPAGTPPNPANWSYEISDVSSEGNNGWGNSERQYYTDDPANAATDGAGNLALTLRQADGSQPCYYGPCEYTSARLISKHKQEFAYGRIESCIKVPQGTGIRSSFWSLGTDIDVVWWPQAGQIDFMDFVGRLPNETFATIQGPGYAGGSAYGNVYDFGEPAGDQFHTLTVEWEPDLIKWYVDGFLYHSATPADVAPNEWVFNDPVYLLLNVSVGGNFGGPVGPDLILPQSLLVDYVRVYQAPDTAERFEATFVDNFSGWQEVVIPFDALTRSASQPAGAPDDGLNLNEVWGYGFNLQNGGTSSGVLLVDFIRLEPAP